MSTANPPAEVPEGLSVGGQKLWRSLVRDYDFDVYEQVLLLQACRTADRLDELAVEAASNPITVENSKGDRVASPAIVESRQQSIVLSRLLASLRLPSGETDAAGALVRPRRRGASRGTYRPRAVA